MTLPPDHALAMPPKSSKPLSDVEVTVVRLWISGGASPEAPARAFPGAPPPVKKVTYPELDPESVARARAPLAQAVKDLQSAYPYVLSYRSRGSAELEINASGMGDRFTDEDLARFDTVSGAVVRADLSRTELTDASARRLTAMSGLKWLRLDDTSVSDRAVRALTALPGLEVVTLNGASTSRVAADELRAKGVRVYDGQPGEDK